MANFLVVALITRFDTSLAYFLNFNLLLNILPSRGRSFGSTDQARSLWMIWPVWNTDWALGTPADIWSFGYLLAEALIGGKLFRAGDQLSAALRCVVLYCGIVAACARTNIFDTWKVLAAMCCIFKLVKFGAFSFPTKFSLEIQELVVNTVCTIVVRMQKTNKFYLS